MTAADIASINLHSDVYHVLQLMAPQVRTATEQLEVSVLGVYFMLKIT